MFEQAPQPEHAHVVIPHEVGGDLERVAHLIIDAVRDALGEASLCEHIPGRGDIGRDSFVPLVSHFDGHSLDADTDRTRSCPVESSRVESSRAVSVTVRPVSSASLAFARSIAWSATAPAVRVVPSPMRMRLITGCLHATRTKSWSWLQRYPETAQESR